MNLNAMYVALNECHSAINQASLMGLTDTANQLREERAFILDIIDSMESL